MTNFLHYIEKKNLLKMLVLISVQQSFMALGTYALAKAGLCFDDRQQFIVWVQVSLVLYLITPCFAIFIRRLETQLGLNAYSIFLQDNLFSKAGAASLWQNKDERDRFLASIGSDANDYLALILFISMDIYSFSLSLILGVLVLGFTIDLTLVPAFVLSGVLSFLIYQLLSSSVEKKYHNEQSSRTELIGHLLKSWDNILLNNDSVRSNFQKQFLGKINQTVKNAGSSAAGAEFLIFILGLASGIPVLCSVCWILWDAGAENQKNILIALLATLPRQLNILGVFRSIYQSLTNLLGIRAKFDVIIAGTSLRDRDLIPSIKIKEITFNYRRIESVESLIADISFASTGRYEIRGPNGSGKSTLLLHLNKILPSSFYLPSHPDLALDIKSVARSTGENLLDHIEYIKALPEKIILLDEWDANLDQANMHILEEQIRILSKTKMVLEVRHREAFNRTSSKYGAS